MPHLPESSDSKTSSGAASIRRFLRDRRRRASKAILKSYRMRALQGRDLPIRIRPVWIYYTVLRYASCSMILISTSNQWFLVFTCLTIVLLGLLGFTNIARCALDLISRILMSAYSDSIRYFDATFMLLCLTWIYCVIPLSFFLAAFGLVTCEGAFPSTTKYYTSYVLGQPPDCSTGVLSRKSM